MFSDYVDALQGALLDALQLLVRLALPIAIVAGAALAVAAAAFYRDPERWREAAAARRAASVRWAGYLTAALFAYAGYSALQALLPVAQQQVEWMDSAEATRKPKIDAEPIAQAGPVVAALTEQTYTRRLTLPPDLVSRIGSEGIGVLEPYLEDPTTENVLKLVDSFKHSGQDVVFSREVTRLEEEPLALAKSEVVAETKRLDDGAFDLGFSGTFTFRNDQPDAIDARFLFPVPQVGSMRDLKVEVEGAALPDPDERGNVEWRGPMQPGESKTARVNFHVVGAGTWEYRVGSRRRRVEDFRLTLKHDGDVRFPRYSMKPASQSGGQLGWQLSNVITDERIAMSFPSDSIGLQTYLQALESMPIALAFFVLGTALLGALTSREVAGRSLMVGIAALTLGFLASAVAANYLGQSFGILVTPILGGVLAGLATRPVGWVPAVLAGAIPAAFLSAENTGLLLVVYALLGWWFLRKDLVAARAEAG